MILTSVYLGAIVTANLAVTHFGPASSIPIAFLLVGLDLTTRDALHDRWRHRHLPARMGALIAAGGVISYALNRDAGRIAIASCVAFTLAALVDATAYWALRNRPALQRSNGSNIPAALVDSVLFPTIAFGVFAPAIIAGQFAAKVLGGLVWSLVLFRRARHVEAVTA
jgi:queuosine precursor transporter